MGTTSVLPVEIIEFEILTLLPVKSLLRFKSVCKSWNLLISSRGFKIKSVRNSSHDSFMLISMRKAIISNNDLWYYEKVTNVTGCIDGLLCIRNIYQGGKTIRFKISNPATKQCLEIELPTKASDFQDYDFGFVFDSVANDYKIMCAKVEEQQRLAGYIYSCNGGCWSEITPSNFFLHGNIYSGPFIFNGSAFWLITQTHDRKDRLIVISFDAQEETFRLLPDLGEFERSSNRRYMLVKFRESLAIMFFNNTLFVREETIDIFIFNERCENWSKTSIGPFKFWKGEPIVNSEPKFLGCFNNSDILFLYPKSINNKYYVNLQNYTIKSLGKGDLFEDYMYGLTNYSESLSFIDGMKPFSGTEDEIRYYCLRKE